MLVLFEMAWLRFLRRRFDKTSAKYYFPLPEEKRKARIDVYQLVGTCSVPVDPAAWAAREREAILSKTRKNMSM